MSFVRTLDDFVDYAQKAGRPIRSAVVAVTERYARRKLKIKQPAPLEYKGLHLRCIGSKRWRQENCS